MRKAKRRKSTKYSSAVPLFFARTSALRCQHTFILSRELPSALTVPFGATTPRRASTAPPDTLHRPASLCLGISRLLIRFNVFKFDLYHYITLVVICQPLNRIFLIFFERRSTSDFIKFSELLKYYLKEKKAQKIPPAGCRRQKGLFATRNRDPQLTVALVFFGSSVPMSYHNFRRIG